MKNWCSLVILLLKFFNLLIIIEEVGILGVMFEMCGVWGEFCVLWEVLFKVIRLGFGVGVLRDLFWVCVLLELLKLEVECICLVGF